MNIKEDIKNIYKLKNNIPDILVKEINLYRKKIYVVVIQTLTSENKINDFILKYFSNKDLLKNKTNIKK